jgi:hypothetical protein
MKVLRLIAVIALSLPVAAQAAGTIPEKPEMSLRDQIRAARAKYLAEEAAEKTRSPAQPWDRDANGKRPWETNEPAK